MSQLSKGTHNIRTLIIMSQIKKRKRLTQTSSIKILQHNDKLKQSGEKNTSKNCPKIIKKTITDVDAAVPPVSISGEHNALSHRLEEDSVTYIRRRRAATQSDDDPEKRANDTNELSASADTKHVVPSQLPTSLVFSSCVSRYLLFSHNRIIPQDTKVISSKLVHRRPLQTD